MKVTHYDEVLVFQDGDLIARDGEESRDMFVVQSGRVEVLKDVDGQEVLLATLERGSFFGEMSLLESLPRSATVRAQGETKLLVIRAGSLLLKIRRDPTFAFEMLQQMSRRIRTLNEQLTDTLHRLELSRAEAQNATLRQAVSEYQVAGEVESGGRE